MPASTLPFAFPFPKETLPNQRALLKQMIRWVGFRSPLAHWYWNQYSKVQMLSPFESRWAIIMQFSVFDIDFLVCNSASHFQSTGLWRLCAHLFVIGLWVSTCSLEETAPHQARIHAASLLCSWCQWCWYRHQGWTWWLLVEFFDALETRFHSFRLLRVGIALSNPNLL